MTTKALYVHLKAKPGKERDLEEFLKAAAPIVQGEPDTVAWFAIKMGDAEFAIFDAFPSDAGRDAHLQGDVAAALMQKADELLAEAPAIHRIDVLADKLPG